MNADEFKRRMFALHNFPRNLQDEVERSDLSYMHIYLGIVPNGMTLATFLEIIRTEELKFNKRIGMPLLPPVQRSWDGSQVADWLISGGMVDKSKRSIITEKLDGRRFLEGDFNGVLTKEEIEKINSRLAEGIYKRSCHVSHCFHSRALSSIFFRRFFNMEFEKEPSRRKFIRMFNQKYSITFRIGHPAERIEKEQLGFSRKYQGKEIIEKSFVSHIVNLCDKSQEYFACYTFLGQSSGMGKSRLLYESWENEEYALFILRISCAKSEKLDEADLETGKLVRFILGLRTQEQMSRLLWCLLYLVLDRSLDENGFLKYTEKRSHSLHSLNIDFEEVLDLYRSPNSNAIDTDGFKVIQEKISKMKLSKPGVDVVKKVIPVIAFDEADILSKSTFEIEVPIGAAGSASSNRKHFDTFRLIRRVLNSYKNELYQCPFVFVGSNEMIAKYGPSSLEDVDFGEESGGTASEATKLFDPYILLHTFGIFANYKTFPSEKEANLDSYICGSNYSYDLCDCGRPLWGSMLQTRQAKKGNLL